MPAGIGHEAEGEEDSEELVPAYPMQASNGDKGPQLLIGTDDDRQDNAAIQAGAVANPATAARHSSADPAAMRSSSSRIEMPLRIRRLACGSRRSCKPGAVFTPVTHQDVEGLDSLVATMIR